MRRALLSTLLGLALAMPSVASADLDPRDYVGVPPGTFAMITYYRHITADKMFADDDQVTNNAGLDANVGIFRPVYYSSIAGWLYNIQALIIVGDQELDGDLGADLSSSGFFDPVLLGTFWFINDNQSQTWLGFTPYFTIPIGSYNDDKGFNNGANRWAFKEELMLAKGLGNGWFLDIGGSVEFYTDNNDFGPTSAELAQDPLWTFETHLSYDITKKWYVGASYYFHYDGETEIDGVDQNNKQSNHSWVGTMVFGIDDNYNLQLQYRNDFSVKSGFKTDAFQVRFLYFF